MSKFANINVEIAGFWFVLILATGITVAVTLWTTEKQTEIKSPKETLIESFNIISEDRVGFSYVYVIEHKITKKQFIMILAGSGPAIIPLE